MKKKLTIFKTVKLNHLEYTIHFMDMKYLKGVPILGDGYSCISGDHETTIFLKDIEKTVTIIDRMPFIAHEIVHAIQNICECYSMDFTKEQEHTAYIMFHCLEVLLNKK